ncbi:restriction endonuclease subunit S, partial [Roseinatronobacter sp.]|uniref:restriction endonuclease subunit S n=1 Tax=Roseinatronobacter sp. TaxID=1945755 RepID=UPI0025EF69D3
PCPGGESIRRTRFVGNCKVQLTLTGVTFGQGINEATTMAFGDAPSRARRIVRSGDVLVSTVRTYLKALALVENAPGNLVASTGFAVLRPREIEPSFLGHVVSSDFFVGEVISRSVGVSYPAINSSDLIRIAIPVPPLAEQQAIAAFLDRETGKIDALVEQQRRLIALLKEKRQAVISHAVTKGLDPDAPLKPSGIDWLGDIPAHWVARSINSLSKKSPTDTSAPHAIFWSMRV